MIELPDIEAFPVSVVVALQTVLPKPSFVVVLMACGASLREAKESPIEILDFDGGTIGLRHMVSAMASIAREAYVFSFQCVTGQLVIEGLGIPLDQRKVLAVVIGVAARTLLTGTGLDVVGGMQAFVGTDTGSYLGVAVETLERWLSCRQPMTGRAIRSSVKRLMRTGQRSGRNLSVCG